MREAGRRRPSRLRPYAAGAVAAALAAYAATLSAPPARADLPPERTAGVDLADPDTIRAGGESFNGLCAGYCHGTGGTAKRGPALRNRPELDAASLYYTIVNGRRRSGNPMPPWKDLLSDEEIWTIVAYIVSLRDAPPYRRGDPRQSETPDTE